MTLGRSAFDSFESAACNNAERRRSRLLHLISPAVTGAVCLAGAGALLWPGQMLSREMTWDLLFNLSGAWHVHVGHVPHQDFHDPVGSLNFALTNIGFDLVGITPRAFLVGTMIMALGIFATATLAASHRLPRVSADIFVLFVTLLVLQPCNVGDQPGAYSYAMSYNRYGWSAISVLALILFLPPRNGAANGFGSLAGAAGLLLVLFHLKVTYFVVGVGGVALAVLVCRHLQARRTAWLALLALAALYTVAPHNRAYVADVFAAASGGAVRSGLNYHLDKFFAFPMESAPYIAAGLVAAGLWWKGRAPLELPAAILFLFAAGLALLSQNAQSHGLPIAILIVFMLYGRLASPSLSPLSSSLPAPRWLGWSALLVFPAMGIAAMTFSLAGYARSATTDQGLFTVQHTRLAGLAVPADRAGLLTSFASRDISYSLLNRARSVAPRYELSQYEYVSTLLEASSFLELLAAPRIVVLDSVNPFPFMMGLPPVQGEALWWDESAQSRPEAEVFAEADLVLIPKFATHGAWRDKAVAQYGRYLDANFPFRLETTSWIMAGRKSLDPEPNARVADIW